MIVLEMIRQGLPVTDIVIRMQSLQVYTGGPVSTPKTLMKYINALKKG